MVLERVVMVVQVERDGRYQGHNVYYLGTLTLAVPRVPLTNIADKQILTVYHLS